MPAKKSAKATEKSVEKTPAKPKAAEPAAKKAAAKPEALKANAEKQTAPKKPATKQSAAPMGSSLFDTSRAASNAAAMLGAKFATKATGGSTLPESAMFKQMKSGLNKPHATSMNNMLDKSHGPDSKKSNQPFAKQSGHIQTKSDVARVNVPRRTAG